MSAMWAPSASAEGAGGALATRLPLSFEAFPFSNLYIIFIHSVILFFKLWYNTDEITTFSHMQIGGIKYLAIGV